MLESLGVTECKSATGPEFRICTLVYASKNLEAIPSDYLNHLSNIRDY